MGVPKKRKTKAATRERRSHHRLVGVNLARCKNCNERVRPHEICWNCGHYRGKAVSAAAETKKSEASKPSK